MYITACISLLVSIPCFVVGSDGAGRGQARSLATRRVELFSHDASGNWTLLLPVASRYMSLAPFHFSYRFPLSLFASDGGGVVASGVEYSRRVSRSVATQRLGELDSAAASGFMM